MQQSNQSSSKVTDIATKRVARTALVSEMCKYNEAAETVMTANIRFMMAWQRTLMRTLSGS